MNTLFINDGVDKKFSYETAFSRHAGLLTAGEQGILRNSRIAIAGLGGVGGIHLATLARLGVGRFTIVDPDLFEVSNFNRQYGAALSTCGKSKATVMADIVRDINPGADVRVMPESLTPENIGRFLDGAHLLVDGIDAFEIELRRTLYRLAAKRGLYVLAAGPFGFSTAWLIFDPRGMSFDDYFDLSDGLDATEQFARFVLGMAPKATHRSYLDFAAVNVSTGAAPSVGFACSLAAGVVGAEAVKILLRRGPLKPVPAYHQFDPYLGKFASGRLLGGNRHPLQRLKRRQLARFLKKRSAMIVDKRRIV